MSEKGKKVFKFDLDGNLVAEFKSIRAALRSVDMGKGGSPTLKNAVSKQKPYKGYLWSFSRHLLAKDNLIDFLVERRKAIKEELRSLDRLIDLYT